MNSKTDTHSQTPSQTSLKAGGPVDQAITSRRSVRAYLNKPISKAEVEDLLRVASWAPSGTNTQPWQVHVLGGESKTALSQKILAAFTDPALAATHQEDYHYYPAKWVSPYVDRRRKVGWDMYGLLGIGKEDKAKMQAQHAQNYRFFDAPIGLIFTIDRVMQQGSWLDYGMFLQTLMIAARGRGMDTCPQAAFTQFHRIIAEHLNLAPEQQVVCGMALGYSDSSAVVNQLRTVRESPEQFAKFHGLT
jgi:nitroreductase